MDVAQVLDHLEVDLLDKIESLSPKDYCSFWVNIKEFEVAKLQRASAAPLSQTGNNFTVEHVTEVVDED